MTDTEPTRTRLMRETDRPFVFNAWIRSFAPFSRIRRLSRDFYGTFMSAYIGRILAEPRTVARVECDASDEDTLLGFAVFSDDTLHYVFVKTDFRHMGIAAKLLTSANLCYMSTKTRMGDERLKPHARGWQLSPRYVL